MEQKENSFNRTQKLLCRARRNKVQKNIIKKLRQLLAILGRPLQKKKKKKEGKSFVEFLPLFSNDCI